MTNIGSASRPAKRPLDDMPDHLIDAGVAALWGLRHTMTGGTHFHAAGFTRPLRWLLAHGYVGGFRPVVGDPIWVAAWLPGCEDAPNLDEGAYDEPNGPAPATQVSTAGGLPKGALREAVLLLRWLRAGAAASQVWTLSPVSAGYPAALLLADAGRVRLTRCGAGQGMPVYRASLTPRGAR